MSGWLGYGYECTKCVCKGGGGGRTIPVCSAEQVGAPQCRMPILRNVNVTCPYRLFSPMSHVEEKYKSHVILSPCRLSLSPMSHVEFKKWPCRLVKSHWGILLCATPYTHIHVPSLENQGETLNLICVIYLLLFFIKAQSVLVQCGSSLTSPWLGHSGAFPTKACIPLESAFASADFRVAKAEKAAQTT